MEGTTELENASRWIARAAGRYAVWLAVVWAAYTAYVLTTLRHVPDAGLGVVIVGLGLALYLGLPTLLLIALLVPTRRFPWHRPVAALVLCAPALIAVPSGPRMLIALLLFQIIFGAVLLPRPRPASAGRTR